MQCLPATSLDTDIAFWVSREEFLRSFDQSDFLCRNVMDVQDAYLRAWFHSAGSNTYFFIPPVQIVSGKTQFLSGRHRTAVLLRHLDEVPVSFETRFGKAVPSHISMRRLDMTKPMTLPDLPYLPEISNA